MCDCASGNPEIRRLQSHIVLNASYRPGMTRGFYFVSGQPLSLAVKKALSPGTTASCL